ncbi:MAG: MFS transporter [Actinobacteria bacterium]|nr:MFS transporter [Actinomycetota bacterium]
MTGNAVEISLLARRARNSLWSLFFLMGIVSMAWVPRIPEIKRSFDLSDGFFGIVLICSGVGAALGAQVSGGMVHRFGSQNVTRVAQIFMPSGLVVVALAPAPAILMAGLFLLGFAYAAIDVSVNSQAVVVEKLLSKRLMVSFHGAWSIGAFSTTVFGGAISNLLTPRENLLLVAVIALAIYIPSTERLLGSDRDEHLGVAGDEPRSIPVFGKAVIPIWLMALGALGALIGEGSASDWGGILLEDHLGVTKGVSASAFASFALAMIISRFVGDHLFHRFGMYQVVSTLALASSIIWISSILISWQISATNQTVALILVNIGFFVAGFGIGPMFPAFMLAAGTTPGIPASVGIGRVAFLAIAGYFIGPTITGLISEATTLPLAMIYPAMMLALGALMARKLLRFGLADAKMSS